METFGQSDDPPGHSRSSIWTDFLAGTIALVTIVVPLYLTVEFSTSTTPPIFPAQTARGTQEAHEAFNSD